MFTEHERIFLLMMRGWSDRRRSYACDRTKSTVIRTIQRFEKMGFVKDRNRQGRLAIATNPDKRLNVLQSFIEDPRNSIRKIAQQHDILCQFIKF